MAVTSRDVLAVWKGTREPIALEREREREDERSECG